MATVVIANTTANISGKTVILAERDHTITGSWTFSRSPSAPFSVTASSAVVTNLDADKLDGLDSLVFARQDGVGNAIGQIAFPAVQVPSTGVNILDDYEEGTWTPVLGGDGGTSGQTYSTQVGRYIKVGKLVTCFGRTSLTAKGVITGNLAITGLPFTSENVSGLNGVLHVGFWNNFVTSLDTLTGIVAANTTTAVFFATTAAATVTAVLATADVGNTTDVVFSITYQASA